MRPRSAATCSSGERLASGVFPDGAINSRCSQPLELAAAEQGDGVANGADVARRPEADGVYDTQQVYGECGFTLELLLDPAGVGVVAG